MFQRRVESFPKSIHGELTERENPMNFELRIDFNPSAKREGLWTVTAKHSDGDREQAVAHGPTVKDASASAIEALMFRLAEQF